MAVALWVGDTYEVGLATILCKVVVKFVYVKLLVVSNTIIRVTPNRVMMFFHMNHHTSTTVMEATASVSTHLMK